MLICFSLCISVVGLVLRINDLFTNLPKNTSLAATMNYSWKMTTWRNHCVRPT